MTQATNRPWKMLYRKGPQYPLAGWIIYDTSDIERPIAVVAETIGGTKDKSGRSPYQTANAALIVRAVNSHDDLIDALQSILVSTVNGNSIPKLVRERAIQILRKAGGK